VNSSEYQVLQISAERSGDVSDVVRLGDKNRKTLGFLPHSGYSEAAERRHIVLAVSTDGTLAGYCLYAPTRTYVRIVHLCVDNQHLGRGLARRMVESVNELNPQSSGLRLKCRRDWPSYEMWPKLGFRPRTDVTGRSAAGHLLTVWWRASASEMDLFSVQAHQSDVPLVAIDSNVFSDLHSTRADREGRFSGAVALLAGDNQIQLALPSSVPAELNRTADDVVRRRLLDCTASYPVLAVDEHAVSRAHADLLANIDNDVLTRDASLRNDSRLIVEAALGGADVYITRDVNAVRHIGGRALDVHGISVLDPTELAAFLHRREFDADYLPARLQETSYEVSSGDHSLWSSRAVDALLNTASSERRAAFSERIRSIAELSAAYMKRNLLLNPAGEVVAAWATRHSDADRIEVPLLRVSDSPLATTISRQLLHLLRNDLPNHSATAIRITDPHPSAVVVASMPAEGFSRTLDDGWAATSLAVCGDWATVREHAIAAHAPQVPPDALPNTIQAAELEKAWWPVKINDADLPTYVVPIRSNFAYDLLGHTTTLLTRPATLGLSRENVYYRSARTKQEAPGRILWYSSKVDKAIVACSRLVETGIGSPESLFRQFERLGVWDLDTIRQSANATNEVAFLRFADTEIFKCPVGLDTVRLLSAGHATLPSLQPVKISNQLFTRLYQKGRGIDQLR
jgi:hypothetical protein